jgi:hypothetical protein
MQSPRNTAASFLSQRSKPCLTLISGLLNVWTGLKQISENQMNQTLKYARRSHFVHDNVAIDLMETRTGWIATKLLSHGKRHPLRDLKAVIERDRG